MGVAVLDVSAQLPLLVHSPRDFGFLSPHPDTQGLVGLFDPPYLVPWELSLLLSSRGSPPLLAR